MVEEIRNGTLVEALLEIWRRRKWLLMGSFVAVVAIALSVIKALPDLYRASTTVLVGQEEIEESLVRANNGNELQQRLDVIQQAILSRSRLLRVIEQYDLYPDMREAPVEGLIGRMRGDIGFQRQIPQNLPYGQRAPAFPLTITYQAWEPELAATVANALAELYKEENERIRIDQASNTTAFLKEQLEAARLDVAEREREINEFKTKHLGALPQQDGVNMATLQRLNNQLTLNGQKQVQLMAMRDNPGLDPAALADAALDFGPYRLENLKQQLQALTRTYTDNYPAVIRVRNQIAELEAAMPEGGWPVEESAAEEGALVNDPADIPSELERLRKEEESLRTQIDELHQRIVYSPAVEQELQQLTNSYDSARALFLSLQDRYQSARLAESLEIQQEQQFQVLEPAIPPPFPAEPKSLRLVIMSLVMSVGFAAGLVFLVEQLDNTFHTPRELRNFTNLPVLGSISRINTTGDRFRHGFRTGLVVLAYGVGLAVLVVLSNNLGESMGRGIVWTLAGTGA